MNLRVPRIKTNTVDYIKFEIGVEYTFNDFKDKSFEKN